jgi:hypothetical protein
MYEGVMSDPIDMSEPADKTNEDDRSTLNSKIALFAIVAIIVAGTGFWYLLTVWASDTPVGPETAKQFAKDFERECFLKLEDEQQCRTLIGKHHRDCLFDNIERVESGTGDNGGNVVHDRNGYMTCMRASTGVSY